MNFCRASSFSVQKNKKTNKAIHNNDDLRNVAQQIESLAKILLVDQIIYICAPDGRFFSPVPNSSCGARSHISKSATTVQTLNECQIFLGHRRALFVCVVFKILFTLAIDSQKSRFRWLKNFARRRSTNSYQVLISPRPSGAVHFSKDD